MLEVALVIAAVAGVAAVGFLASAWSPSVLVVAALVTLAGGLVVGVPTGFWYHVVLYRLVSAKRPVPRRWWLSPSSLHVHLTDAEQRRIAVWYRLGGLGFVLSMVGGLGAIAVLLIAR